MAQSTKDQKLYTEVQRHYDLATEDLDARLKDFDTADELFRSYIDESSWPYSSLIFAPRIFAAIFEKTARLVGAKPRGRLVPREGGDVLGAKINNELLSFQWDDAARIDGTPLVAKWALMDMNARKYGASFALCKWRFERRIKKDRGQDKEPVFRSEAWYDGPDFQILNNRDVLLNPSYSVVKNWFQHREYLTYAELLGVNDSARGAPIYKNLDTLRDKMHEDMKVLDSRETNYTPRSKTIKGLQDFLGQDEYNRIIEVVTEYRSDRWITFAPKHGVILRDIENPYDHQEIPVVMLKYYPIDDDIYGLSEIEPVEKLQKALNAIVSQYIDAKNLELYSPIGVDSTRVRMHTLEFGAGKRWITTGDPRTAIHKFDFATPGGDAAFKNTYSMLVSEMQEALGETSAITSNLNPFGGKDKTATEVRDLASQRLSRDNFNQIFLSEALKRQMMLWHSMNQQFLFGEGDMEKILRITSKDAIQYFQERGLDEVGLEEDAESAIAEMEAQGVQVNMEDFMTPLYPVETEQGMAPKMMTEPQESYAEVRVTPEDISGNYDYIPDIETMQPPNNEQMLLAKRAALDMVKDPQSQQLFQMEGVKPKFTDLVEDYLEDLGFKDAGKYFESLTPEDVQAQQAGGGIPPTGEAPFGAVPPQGIQAGPQAVPGNPGQPGIPGPVAV